jgi:alpha-beta hydrolase superfamily lysophospholipase
MSHSRTPRPLYLNTASEGVFALFHDASDRTRETAVLLCPPFGFDPMCPHCKLVRWGARLAADGYPTLHIDLPGSGNSAGDPGDPARLQAWTEAVSGAARWLRATSGASRIVAVGVGLGGLVAYQAAFDPAPLDDLVLWAVPARGQALVRELRLQSRLSVSRVSAPGDPGLRLLPEGAVLAAGYLLSASTGDALEALDLTELPLPNGRHRRVLLLGRGGPDVDELLRGALELTGVDVTVASGRGYGSSDEVFEPVAAWLAAGEAQRDRSSAAVTVPATGGHASAKAEEPSSQEHLRLSWAGVQLQETPVWVDRPSGRLPGVLTEPLHGREQLCLVLLAGHHRHTGPNRMWVEIARRWAARGVPTLRIDLSPLADSEEDASTDAGGRFGPEYVDETCAVLDMLAARGLPARFVVGGLSAGAYWSMHAALRDERIAAVIMLNPRALIWSEQVQAARAMRTLRRRMPQSFTLRGALRGKVTPRRFVELSRSLAALAVHRSRARSRRSWPGTARRPDPVQCLLDTLRDRGQRGLLVFTSREPLREELAATGLFDRLDRWPNLELRDIETSVETHMLTPLWLQRHVHELVDQVLDRELELAAKGVIRAQREAGHPEPSAAHPRAESRATDRGLPEPGFAESPQND